MSATEEDRPDPGAFDRIADELDYPMYVVTAAAGADRVPGRAVHRAGSRGVAVARTTRVATWSSSAA
jgi:hypothetical protein